MKTLVIIGAGKGLGLSLAKRFGKAGFQIALVARNAINLQDMIDVLKENYIEASYFIADVYQADQMTEALANIKNKYGSIDVLEFSPTAGKYPPISVLELTAENIKDLYEGYIFSAIHVVNTVVSDMLVRQEGALLFTTGLSALYPVPMMGNVGIIMAGLRNYIANLHTELSPKGIFVGHRSLGLWIKESGNGTVNDPDVIADMWYKAYIDQAIWEEEYPKGVTPTTIQY